LRRDAGMLDEDLPHDADGDASMPLDSSFREEAI
jgi:hypothetical protein